ncbi:hypothetical protein ANN_10674, partial [Periplaneta americana]
RKITLHELLEIMDSSETIPNNGVDVALLPPLNANDLTDEDSGAEDDPYIDNLPASQLSADVFVTDMAINNAAEREITGEPKNEDSTLPSTEWPLMYEVPLKPGRSPLEYFTQFFDEEILNMMVTYTNQYAAKKNRVGDCSENEMVFLAVLLLSGYVVVPRRRMHCQGEQDSHNEFVSNAISRDRFDFIMMNWYVCNNDDLEKSDRFAKIRTLLSMLNERKRIWYDFKFWCGGTSNGYFILLEPYQEAGTYSQSITIAKWNDNSVVTIATNYDEVFPLRQVGRFSKEKKRRIAVPLFESYNSHMGGIDRGDQNVSLYRTSIRGKKWYFPIIAHLIDVAEQNAWLLYRRNEENVDHLSFQRRVATAILESNKGVLTSKGRPSKVSQIESWYDGGDYYISDLPVDIHTHKKQLKCRICQKKATTMCVKCDLPLHVSCFVSFHTK